jgi:hypothetical protein
LNDHSVERTEITVNKLKNRLSTFAVATIFLLSLPFAVYPQGAGAPSIVGVAPVGANALEFLARSDQDGMTVTHYGYLTHISDLPDESLFSNPSVRTEATARFTFSATTTLTARHLLGNIIATSAVGTLTIYFNQALGADFGNPASFTNGQPIATFSVRFQNILNVQSPDSGESTAVADLAQLQARSFTLDGRNLRLGQHALRARLFATGQGTRTQVDPPKSSFLLAGNITVTKPKSTEPDR